LTQTIKWQNYYILQTLPTHNSLALPLYQLHFAKFLPHPSIKQAMKKVTPCMENFVE
jgi:hypothetical protein